MRIIVSLLLLLSLFSGCDESRETPVKGSLTVYVDEGLENVVKALADSFLATYKNAEISVQVVKAREGAVKIVNGEAEMFISTREFNDEEINAARANKLEYKKAKFCYDGVYVIGRFDAGTDTISYSSLKNFLGGRSKTYRTVIPSVNSGVYEFLKTGLLGGTDPAGAEVKATESEVLTAVKSGKNVIGFVSANVMQDSSEYTIYKIGVQDSLRNTIQYLEPHPGYYVQDLYPLTRLCVIYLTEINIGLASGFTSYLTGNLGQKFVLDNKLGPATVPVKVVR
ncbi:MAG: substrate-binding domain-containing protein [Ignavibacteriaceae bacterium]|nr:substrate-binding domain-containing protein [Ignavibacteriaceae bacterium]